MKVLFTVASMAGGGAERVISILANHLAEEGHQAAVIMTAGDTVDYSMDSRVELLSVGGITGGSMIKRFSAVHSRTNFISCQLAIYIILPF